MLTLIGIAGPAGSGKTTLANFLVQEFNRLSGKESARVYPFAAPLKRAAQRLGWDGKKDERGRRFLQLLGTDAVRGYNPDTWVNIWREMTEQGSASYVVDTAIADDVRFENEVKCIRERGGFLIKLTARGYVLSSEGSKHVSEIDLDDSLFDVVIDNSGSLDKLIDFAWKTVARLQWQRGEKGEKEA